MKSFLKILLATGLASFLFLCSAEREQAELPDPYPSIDWNVEMTSQEVIDNWLEEQAQEAKEFFSGHEELFSTIAEVSLAPTANEALAELLSDYDMTYTYTGSDLLELSYAFTEFPTAIYCNVSFLYAPDFSTGGEYDLGDGWHIQTDYHHMYGL